MIKKSFENLSEELRYIPIENAETHFYSHDIGLVAYLLCEGFELESLDKVQRNKVMFILTKQEGLDDAIKNYWNFRSSVDAQSYFNQIKRLKNQIYSE